MIKLYILYSIFGFYMFFDSVAMWTLSAFNGADTFVTYLAIVSSMVFCSIASSISIRNIKLAVILGIVCLIGVFPFGIHWLIYRYEFELPLTSGTENQIILFATAIYIISVFYSAKYMINYKRVSVIVLKRPLKLFLTYLPTFLLVILIILGFINP